MPNYPKGQIYPGYGGFFAEKQGRVSIIRTCIYPSKSVRMAPRLANYFSFMLSSLIIGALTLPKIDFLITKARRLSWKGSDGSGKTQRARWILNVSDLWLDSLKEFGVLKGGHDVPVSQ